MKPSILQPLLMLSLLQIASACQAELVAFPVTTHVERTGSSGTRMSYSVQLVDIPTEVLDTHTEYNSKRMLNLISVDISRTCADVYCARPNSGDSTSVAKTPASGTTVREVLVKQNYQIGETGVIETAYLDMNQVDRCLSAAIVSSPTTKGTGSTIQEAYSSLLAGGGVWSPSNVCAQTPPPTTTCSLTSPGTIDLGTKVVHAGGQGVAGRTQLTLTCNMQTREN